MLNTILKRKNKRKNSQIIKERILKGIENFNEIRVPEAKAELIEFKGKSFLVKFSGYMCYTCGTYDYFEDLVFELRDLQLNCKIADYKNFGDYFLVKYQILEKERSKN